MIPEFQEDGNLPPGVHRASLDEVEQRFGLETELRRSQMESIRWMVDAAQRAGVLRVVINGSFVTDAYEPNDVDCVLLIDDTFTEEMHAEDEFEAGWPFLEIELVRTDGFQFLIDNMFASDRLNRPKGMIEVLL